MVTLLGRPAKTTEVRVVVFDSADPDFFIAHVDLTNVAEYSAEAAKEGGGPQDAFLSMVLRKLSEVPVVTIAKLRGRARGAGSEFVLACDMCFAARERAARPARVRVWRGTRGWVRAASGAPARPGAGHGGDPRRAGRGR
ncbi:enoyl-CoA hydratase-related protein [Micromonospora sp. NPDC023966]|uniref:enoyl-CoA hydratase-related protein n=1 Tax=Micromonospora sp. NPDC023966 TaxID=3154699 RepID=UPI0033C1B22D